MDIDLIEESQKQTDSENDSGRVAVAMETIAEQATAIEEQVVEIVAEPSQPYQQLSKKRRSLRKILQSGSRTPQP